VKLVSVVRDLDVYVTVDRVIAVPRGRIIAAPRGMFIIYSQGLVGLVPNDNQRLKWIQDEEDNADVQCNRGHAGRMSARPGTYTPSREVPRCLAGRSHLDLDLWG